MMKRLICTLAALAMLIWTCPTARAELHGELRRDQDCVINFDNATVERVFENFLRRRTVIAPEMKPPAAVFAPNYTGLDSINHPLLRC